MSSLLTALGVLLGILLLLLSLAGIVFGLFMALERDTREQGVFFVLWWVPAAAAALGMILRDPVTFVIGAVCFVVAGVALAVEHRGSRRSTRRNRTGSTGARKTTGPERTNPGLSWIFELVERRLSGRKRGRGRRRTVR